MMMGRSTSSPLVARCALRCTPTSTTKFLIAAQRSCSTKALNVVLARNADGTGEVVTVRQVMDDGIRALVVGRADEERVCELADSLRGTIIRSGDHLRLDTRSNLLLEKLARPEVEDLLLEEVPDISYTDIGGLDDQIELIADAVELPFLHHDLFAEHQLPAPKGILLYGPPGCGKTLIAKAVANSLANKVAEKAGEGKGRSYFINIKGPELLNKYVGETERQIRLVFQRAREKAMRGGRSSCSSTRWIRCFVPVAQGSAPIWNQRSCLSYWQRSMASRVSPT